MIPFDVEYLRPTTLRDAAAAYRQAREAGRAVRYYGGGTELVTGARDGTISYDVLIDLKRIPDVAAFDPAAGLFGAGLRLSALADQSDFPLLAAAARGVADRTARNSITLGGNLCSMLPYRETALPLLLFDAELTLFGPDGERTARIGDVWNKRLRLSEGEFVVSVALPDAAREPGYYRRRTRDGRIDYPLVTLCAARGETVRFAVGGAFGYPVRSRDAEAALGDALRALPATAASSGDGADAPERAEAAAAIDLIPDRVWSDFRSSPEYRRALLIESLADALVHLEVP